METHTLDPSLPGVRLLQSWIRQRTPLVVQLLDGRQFDGSLDWQDPEFLALRGVEDPQPFLIRRGAVAVIRPTG